MRRATSVTALALVAVLALVASSCGGGDQASSTSTSVVSTTTRPGGEQDAKPRKEAPDDANRRRAPRRGSNRAAVKQAVAETEPARLDPEQRRVATVARNYIAALDSRDGERACALFVPGALDTVSFPRERGECALSLEASIGYRDPRGFPVYKGSRVARIHSVSIDGADARVVATLVTQFAGQREPSIEDDVVYVQQRGGRWLIVKPSAALYRAIGVGDIPPSVISPPK